MLQNPVKNDPRLSNEVRRGPAVIEREMLFECWYK